MNSNLLLLLIVLNIAVIILLIVLIIRTSAKDFKKYENQISYILKQQERLERVIREEISTNRDESIKNSKSDREEMSNSLRIFGNSISSQMKIIADLSKNQLEAFSLQLSKLTDINKEGLNRMRETLEGKLTDIQNDNNNKLEKMRETVDEKLHNTLETRLGESFKSISQRLEALYKELGEFQSLSNGVNDLRRALTNVKTRGVWGEIQLGNIIDEILTKDQYDTNVATKKGKNERVEFAVKLPGQENGECVWLPIDAKFPQEDYQKLLLAQDDGNKTLIDELSKQLEIRIKSEAKDIRDKYLDPPNTTDFGIMFLPTESLYAEVIKRPGLWDTLQREYRVIITGPTTLAALLNSLQMGFRTLAIEKRSSEVWTLLGAVKTEFGKFSIILEKTQKKLKEASNSIESATKKSRTIERKLKDVQELPMEDSLELIEDEEKINDEM